ncbi:MAG: hypothetical protein ACKOFW_09080 [Planctomycetaceae bacterium]
MRPGVVAGWLALVALVESPLHPARGAEGAAPPHPLTVTTAERLSRLQVSLELLDRGATAYAERRQCFACHHQAVPLAAHRAARRWRAPQPDREAALVQFTLDSFRPRLEALREGRGVGGRGLTAGYALWQLALAEHPADDVTNALVEYLLQTQEEGGEWRLDAVRPPAEESRARALVLAGQGIAHFAGPDQQVRARASLARARDWLLAQPPAVHEDRVARLWGARLPEMPAGWRERTRQELLETQAPDGGWRPTPDFPTDAYATATAVYVLLDTGLSEEDAAVARGAQWLWRAREADGSWHVPTRATPVQVFFDNGDPHGADQFVSMLATGWATAALSRLQPVARP